MNDRDYELITAYIDGALTEAERQMLESRLDVEPDLRSELNSLRQTVILLRQLPDLKAPRNFTLTPAQVEPRSPAKTTLPFPLTVTFSALSAAAAVLLLVFGGYFLLQTSALPMASNLNMTTQQEAQQAAPEQPTAVALMLTATPMPSPSLLPTMPPSTPLADQTESEGESAPAAALAPPVEEQEDDSAGTIMMFEAEAGTATPDSDEETAMFRMAATEMPAASESLTIEGAADTTAGGAGAVMMATQAIRAPNPLMTDAVLFATLGANFAQYADTPLPRATATTTPRPEIQSQSDGSAADMVAEPTLAMPTATAAPTEVALQTGADESDGIVEPASAVRDRAESMPVPDITGLLLLIVGGLLLVIAIVTTILRRRRIAS
jgi:hypothetical protein